MDFLEDLFENLLEGHKHPDRDNGRHGRGESPADQRDDYFLFCIHCGAANDLSDGSCAVCGATLFASGPGRCPSCTSPLPGAAWFCPHCGQTIPIAERRLGV